MHRAKASFALAVIAATALGGCSREPAHYGIPDRTWVELLGAPDEPIAWAAVWVAGEIEPPPSDLPARLTPLLARESPRLAAAAADLLQKRGALSRALLEEAAARTPAPEVKALLLARMAAQDPDAAR